MSASAGELKPLTRSNATSLVPLKTSSYRSTLSKILGKVAIIKTLGDLPRSIGVGGVVIPFLAHAVVAVLFVITLFPCLIIFVFSSEAIGRVAIFIAFNVLLLGAGIFFTRNFRRCRRDASIDEHHLLYTALVVIDDYFLPTSEALVETFRPDGFCIRIVSARGGESLEVILTSSVDGHVTLKMVLERSDTQLELYSTQIEYAQVDATQQIEQKIRLHLSKILQKNFPTHTAKRTAVRLARSMGEIAATPKGDLTLHTVHRERSTPCRTTAQIAKGMYNLLFLGVSGVLCAGCVVFAFQQFIYEHSFWGVFGGMCWLAVSFFYGSCVAWVNDVMRPAKTTRGLALPSAAAVYQLRGDVLSSHFLNAPSDRVSIDLKAPFTSMFTRSPDGVEPARVSLELRQSMLSRTNKLLLSACVDTSKTEDLEDLNEWSQHSLVLDGDAFVSLCEVIEFYAQIEGETIGWRPSLCDGA